MSAPRGAGGGYFSGNAKRLTLLDVISLFEPIGATAARAPRQELERAVDEVLAEIDETARATFGSITLETMLSLPGAAPVDLDQKRSGKPDQDGASEEI